MLIAISILFLFFQFFYFLLFFYFYYIKKHGQKIFQKNKNKDSKSLTNKQGFIDELKRIKLETKRNRKRI